MFADAISKATSIEGLSVALVGPGRVGTSLGSWLRDRGAEIAWIAGRRPDSARRTATALGGEAVELGTLPGKPWNLLLLAPPDALLASIAESLASDSTASSPTADPGRRIALHTSGSQPASVLTPLREAGLAVGSLHPLLGFPDIRRQPVPGTVYGIDGDESACNLARRLALALGGTAAQVPAEQRLLYHYCATLAAGGISTLLAVVEELADGVGLDPAIRIGMLNLTRAAVDAAAGATDAASTITGPIARGDCELARRQLLAAVERSADLEPLLTTLHAESERQVARGRSRSRPSHE